MDSDTDNSNAHNGATIAIATATAAPTFAVLPPISDSAHDKAKHVLFKVTENTQKAMEQTSKTISSWIPSGLKAMTQAKYTLPDKTVASQVLMYRQLLHTKCRPALRLSRPYQGTPAQKCVVQMPVCHQCLRYMLRQSLMNYKSLTVHHILISQIKVVGTRN